MVCVSVLCGSLSGSRFSFSFYRFCPEGSLKMSLSTFPPGWGHAGIIKFILMIFDMYLSREEGVALYGLITRQGAYCNRVVMFRF